MFPIKLLLWSIAVFPATIQIINAQAYHDYIWQLGSRTYGDTSPHSLEFNFNQGEFSMYQIFRDATFFVTSASFSSDRGELQLYSNGCHIYGFEHNIIVNGHDINPGHVHEVQCGSGGGYTSPEGAIFLKLADSIAVLCHTGIEYRANPLDVFVNVLYETQTVQLGNGTFKVTIKNRPIVSDTLAGGYLEATKHISEGWWLITHRRNDNLYYKVHITDLGVTSIDTQSIGKPFTKKSEGSGQAAFSPDGSKYAFWNKDDNLYLMDFNRMTGELSNFVNIQVTDSGSVGGVCFSPNSRLLYVSSQFDLYQVDTEADSIDEAIVHIDHYDGFASPFPTTFYLMQLGPDCRIYMIPNNGADVMHVIHSPDRSGKSCNFEQHGVQLPDYNSISIPNFPNYRLDVGPPCDSTITTGLADMFPASFDARIWPNPATDYINISVPEFVPGKITFTLADTYGRPVLSEQVGGNTERIDLVVQGIANGIYFYLIHDEKGKEILSTGKLVVVGR